jgi:hypothetical protein
VSDLNDLAIYRFLPENSSNIYNALKEFFGHEEYAREVLNLITMDDKPNVDFFRKNIVVFPDGLIEDLVNILLNNVKVEEKTEEMREIISSSPLQRNFDYSYVLTFEDFLRAHMIIRDVFGYDSRQEKFFVQSLIIALAILAVKEKKLKTITDYEKTTNIIKRLKRFFIEVSKLSIGGKKLL